MLNTQERLILLSVVAIIWLGSSLDYAFKKWPPVKRTASYLASSRFDRRLELNAASVEQLADLPGIGPVTARRIVDYRERQSGFRSLEELQEVPGIGAKIYQRLSKLVRLSPPDL